MVWHWLTFDGSIRYAVKLRAEHMAHVSQTPAPPRQVTTYARIILEPTHFKSSPLFTFWIKSLGQNSPSVHLFSVLQLGQDSPRAAKIKLGEDSPSWFVFAILGTTSKPNRRLTGGSVRFWLVSIVLNNDNCPEPDGTASQPAIEFWSCPLLFGCKGDKGYHWHTVVFSSPMSGSFLSIHCTVDI